MPDLSTGHLLLFIAYPRSNNLSIVFPCHITITSGYVAVFVVVST